MTQMTKQRPQRVPLGAFVDRGQHERVSELARTEDRSVSSIVRLALDDYLEARGREREVDNRGS